jgi:hypothetical protein
MLSTDNERNLRLVRIDRQIRMIKITLAVTILLVGSVTLTRLHAKSPAARIFHVSGLVIEDDAGRPRITLGAPASNVGRKRQDAVTGLIFLAEDGTDRLTPGNTTAPQANGKVRNRVAPGVGLLVNDPQGSERGGLGFLDSGRVVVGLDRPDGGEGAALIVNDDDRWSGLVVKDKGERIVISLGNGEKDGSRLLLRDSAGKDRVVLGLKETGQPKLEVRNPEEKLLFDALANAHD